MESISWWSWNYSAEALKNQVENYHTLPLTKSARGEVLLFFGFVFLLSVVVSFFTNIIDASDLIAGAVIYGLLLFFLYKGHRWAIITLLIYSSIDKVATIWLLLENGYRPNVLSIFFLIIGIVLCVRALKVENARIKLKTIPISHL